MISSELKNLILNSIKSTKIDTNIIKTNNDYDKYVLLAPDDLNHLIKMTKIVHTRGNKSMTDDIAAKYRASTMYDIMTINFPHSVPIDYKKNFGSYIDAKEILNTDIFNIDESLALFTDYRRYDKEPTTNNNFKIIHVISPDLKDSRYKSINLESIYTKLYTDIITEFNKYKNGEDSYNLYNIDTSNVKLLLVPISLGHNAGGRENDILDILVPIYINLFINYPNLRNNIELYIYNESNNSSFNYFKKK